MPNDPERHLTLRQADQARINFAAIESDLEFIMARLARMPTRAGIWRAALVGMLGGACLVQTLAFLLRLKAANPAFDRSKARPLLRGWVPDEFRVVRGRCIACPHVERLANACYPICYRTR